MRVLVTGRAGYIGSRRPRGSFRAHARAIPRCWSQAPPESARSWGFRPALQDLRATVQSAWEALRG
jgi:hypothetical protein